ncbi:MAG: hypothetical protein ACD_75C00642G0001 [uncultured bacterium]|nr:MAG: hypothetical protein ACD_75C00642G0001 [uncultured bacterium]
MAINAYRGPHPLQFRYVHETIFENCFRYHAQIRTESHESHELCLQIGGITGIGHRLYIHAPENRGVLWVIRPIDAYGVGSLGNTQPRSSKFFEQ